MWVYYCAALCEDIQQKLIKLKLNLQNSVSQTFDGAANFSDQMKGVLHCFRKLSLMHNIVTGVAMISM